MTAVERLAIDTAGGERWALLRVPDGPVGRRSRATVVLFHGAGGTARLALENTGWPAVADRAGLLLAYPEGTRRDPAAPAMFLQNPQAWNDGSGRGHTARTGVDDVAFVAALLDRLVGAHGADPARIYLAGFSNGAAMTFRAGAELASRVAAIGPVAGHCWVSPEVGPRPVPALMIFGALDPLNPPGGGDVKTPWGLVERHPPVRETFDRWRTFNGCAGTPLEDDAGDGIRRWTATDCRDRAEVRCLTVADLGHHWPGGPRLLPPGIAGPASRRLDGAGTLWRFFQGHQLD